MLQEKLLAHPLKTCLAATHLAAALQQSAHSQGTSGSLGVIDAGLPCLDHRDAPRCKVAHIDELNPLLWIAWREYLPTLGDAMRPVGKAIGGIVRPHDKAGADDKHAVGQCLLRVVLAERFARTIVFRLHRLTGGICQIVDRRALIDRRYCIVSVDRSRRDKGIVPCSISKQASALVYMLRNLPVGIDNRVPGASMQLLEVAPPVSMNLLQLWKQF